MSDGRRGEIGVHGARYQGSDGARWEESRAHGCGVRMQREGLNSSRTGARAMPSTDGTLDSSVCPVSAASGTVEITIRARALKAALGTLLTAISSRHAYESYGTS